ncbi:putative diphthamide synthesis protein [Trypanosoma vivax]|nr:hypothetical protein TRVL_03168 [Trypanosoma vivax]KAH8617934.1 putative diphthamide synthesis protein [Trypanosoma vivax]
MFHDAPVTRASTVRCQLPQRSTCELRAHYKLDEVASFIAHGHGGVAGGASGPFRRVALQFPDELLGDAVAVVQTLKEMLSVDSRWNLSVSGCGSPSNCNDAANGGPYLESVRLFVIADSTFGSCCPDGITAQHYQSDCIVHFGDACMSRSTRMPVFYVQDDFYFNFLRSHVRQRQVERDIEEKSVHVILGAVSVLRRCLSGLCCELREAVEDGQKTRVSLVVAGCHRSRLVVEAAAHQWEKYRKTLSDDGGGEQVAVVWSSFESHGTSTPVLATGQPVSCDGNTGPETMIDEESPFWVINGVRLPRASPPELQFFLFIGPKSAVLPLHLLNIHQYNLFHCPGVLRDKVFCDDRMPPALVTMDESFASGNGSDRVVTELVAVLNDFSGSGSDHWRGHAALEAALEACLREGEWGSGTNDAIGRTRMMIHRRTRQRAFNIEVIRSSSAVGIVVASLAIAGYYEITMLLHKLLRARGRRAYVIYIGHLNEFKLANFVDTVDCFVAVACPNSREGHFPDKKDNFPKPVVSPVEVLLALCAEDEDSPLFGHPAVYSTTFDSILPLLRKAVAAYVGATTGPHEQSCSGAALIHSSTGTLTSHGSAAGALERLHQRSYVGLEPRVGQTPVQTAVVEGQHGIARGYDAERAQQDGRV